ncbi:uncharacterized protein LOC132459163 isoform X2 [Gadus macrocephalus]|nr:uncharacterized protein LOC132459163 isoform X2 [Gadus macrocephalus]
MQASATVVSQDVREDSAPFESAGEDHAVSGCPQQLLENEMQKLLEILTTDIETKDHPSMSESWSLRQSAAQDEWRKARPYHLNSLLSCNEVPIKTCCNCSSQAVIRCRDCMPNEWLCIDCDVTKNQSLALHNRESCVNGMFMPIEPGLCLVHEDGKYEVVSQVRLLPTIRPELCSCDPSNLAESAGRSVILATMNGRYDLHLPKLACKSCPAQWTPDRKDLIQSGYWPASVKSDTLFAADLLATFEGMKTTAPNLSRQGFLRMLDGRTSHFGRTGKIHGDIFQRSFLENTFCNYQCEKMSSVEHFTCAACTPNMLALCADGNRKVYRFRQSKG